MARLEELAYRDFLVGIYNRRGFLKFGQTPFKMAVQSHNYNRREGEKAKNLCLVLLDVDRLKYYNDTYNYVCGDVVLKALGSYFSAHLRETDVFGRWGGDEFVILLPLTETQTAFEIMSNHVKSFSRVTPIAIKKKYHNTQLAKEVITFSFGIASLGKEKTIQALVNKANKSLQLAKKQKNAIVMAKK